MNRSMALDILQGKKAQLTVGDNWREIVDPNFYVNSGWPSDWVNEFHRSHQAEGGAVHGVWHLEFLRGLCKVLEIKTNPEVGAYSEARHMALKIWEKIYEMKETQNEASKKEAS